MKPEAIRRALFAVRKTKTQAALARELGVSPCHINRVIKRENQSKRVKEAIAQLLNKNPEVVWPETFGRKAN